MDFSELDLETRAVHGGLGIRVGDTISTVPPIDASTTFTAGSVAGIHAALEPEPTGFAYARNANPTVRTLEDTMASLESADEVVAFGSGMAAIQAAVLVHDLEPGSEIIAARAVYGVTRALFQQLQMSGISTRYVDALDAEAVTSALDGGHPNLLYLESITNPLLEVPDLRRLTRLAHERNVPVVVDNTFATPILLRPLELDVDLVVHSATKYIAGHGDSVAGLVAGNGRWGRRVRDWRTVTGGILSPFEAWLTLRGIRTLPLRMERQCESAHELAHRLTSEDWIERVYYPGLASDSQHEVAERQFGGRFGGMISFDVRGGRDATLGFLDALELVVPATSLGDVASLVLYPPLSSHRSLSQEAQLEAGIGQGLVRLSVGLESPRDIMRDLQRAAAVALPRTSVGAERR